MTFELVSLVGIALAVLAAALLAVQNVLIRVATDGGTAGDAVVVVMGVNFLLVVPLAVVRHYPEYGLSPVAVGAFAAAGVTGLVLGRLCMFAGIERISASRTTPIVSASTLVAAVLAVLLFSESLALPRVAGIAFIVVGIAVISRATAADSQSSASPRNTGSALLFPIAAAAFTGVEPILVRIGLDAGTPILVGLAVMMTAAFAGYLGYRRLRRTPLPSLVENPHARWYVGAGAASTVGLLAYFGALASAPVVIVIPITHTAPLIVLALSALFLPHRLERVTWPLVAAASLVVLGASLVTLSG